MRTITNLNGEWLFFEGAAGVTAPAIPQDAETVTVPHVWNKDCPKERGCRYYARTLAYEKSPEAPCAFLEFDAVALVARVWVNGQFAGEHRGGYQRFRFDVSTMLQDGDNEIIVMADNTRYSDVSPLSGDFTIFGGIYRSVRLVSVPADHFDLLNYGTNGLRVDTVVADDGSGEAALSAVVCLAEPEAELHFALIDAEGGVAAEKSVGLHVADEEEGSTTLEVYEDLTLAEPHLWNGKKDPYLYTVRAELLVKGVVKDAVSLTCGFRTIVMTPDQGLFLNGEHLILNGVAKHQDFEGAGNAPTEEQLDEDLRLILEIGANTVRLSHYQHPDSFYDRCDRAGLLVWAEIPMLSMPADNRPVIDNAREQLTELILQQCHHPAIYCWGVQNEVVMLGETPEMGDNIRELNDLAHELDPNRLTTCANEHTTELDSPMNEITDMQAYNLYFGWYYGEMKDYTADLTKFHELHPTVPFGISEYGVDCSTWFHSATPKRKDYSEDYQALFHETVYPQFRALPFMWGSYIWNMFDFSSANRDEGGVVGKNCKGLVTYDRKTRKDSFYYYKSWWSEEPFVYLAARRFAKRDGETTDIKVYSNASKINLFVNGAPAGTLEGAHCFIFKDVPLEMGENRIEATACAEVNGVAKSLRDVMTLERVAEVEESYIFVDPNPDFNVRNWFDPDTKDDDMFPADVFSVMDGPGVLLENPEAAAILRQYLSKDFIEHPFVSAMKTTPLIQMINRMSSMFKEEDIKEMNEKLSKIKK